MTAAATAKRGRGRLPGFTMSAEHRAKIQKSNILNALIEHTVGKRDMSSTQVTAGLGLLKKCLPDLSAVELSGDPDRPIEINEAPKSREVAKALALILAKGLQDKQ